PQLTDALLEDISGQDALPLLAFTLAHLHENYAADHELTLSGYDKLGRVRGVIDTAVKQAFAAGVAKGELTKEAKAQLALARAAFIPHLAQVSAAGLFVRRVATRDQIPAEARPLIDSFAEQRLLIKDRRKDADGKDADVVEVAHEALLRQPPFSEWLEEDREFLVGKQQLQNDLRDWAEAKPADKKGALLTGLKLSRMRAWLETRPQDLTPQERDFGRASIEQGDAEERRKVRQRRIVTRASIAAAVVLACFAVVVTLKMHEAQTARDRAQVQLLAFQASRAAREVTSADDTERAGALALASIAEARAKKIELQPYAIEAASWALSLLPLEVLPQRSPVRSLTVLPDGMLASGGKDGSIKIWPKDGGGVPEKTLRQGSAVLSLAVWDGRLVSGGADGNIKLWAKDLTDAPVSLQQGSAVLSLAVWDGQLASGGEDGSIKLWPDDGGGVPQKTLPQGSPVRSLTVLPDGRLASGGGDGVIKLWPKGGGGAPEKVRQGSPVLSLAVWDGQLVGGGEDGWIKLWPKDFRGAPRDLSQGSSVGSLIVWDGRLASGDYVGKIKLWEKDALRVFAQGSSVWSLVVWDGRLASGGEDGNIKLWPREDAPREDASEPVVLTHGGGAVRLAVLRDGRLVSGGSDGAIKIWPEDFTGAPVSLRQPHPVRSLAALPDGRLASGSSDGTIEIWGSGAPVALPRSQPILSLAVLPDGRLASGGKDGSIKIWPKDFTGTPVSLQQPSAVRSRPSAVWSLAVWDGRLASGGEDGDIAIWPKTFAGKPVVLQHGSRVLSLAVAANGLLASGGLDGKIKLWKESFAQPLVLPNGGPVWSLAWLKNGSLASGGDDGTIKLWWFSDNQVPVEETEPSQGKGVTSLAVLADGRLASGGDDGIKLWLTDERKIVAALCKDRSGRNLSKGSYGEWDEYIGGGVPWQASCDAVGFNHSNWRTTVEAIQNYTIFYNTPSKGRPAALPVFSPPAGRLTGEKTSPAPAPVFEDPKDHGEREAATPGTSKRPLPRLAHHPQHVIYTSSNGNTRPPTGDMTTRLNRQELARDRSAASTPDINIFNFFKSLFHSLPIHGVARGG
ncbi:MAG: WD40 repeat domain-containing protein, partial [Stellaceae bacterium]